MLAGLRAGEKVVVWMSGCRPAEYTVKSVSGNDSREAVIEGKRGSQFVLWRGDGCVFAHSNGRDRRVKDLVTDDIRRMRDAEAAAKFAARRLPLGYSIRTTDEFDGPMHRAMLGELEIGPARIAYSDPMAAAVEAWVHYADTQVREHEKTVASLVDARIAVGEIKIGERRCRKALQQISEIAHGLRPTCKALPDDYPPEQVVADVAHSMLLC